MQIATAHLHATINMSTLLSRTSCEALHWQNTLFFNFLVCVWRMSEENSVPNDSPDIASITSTVFDQFKRYLDQKVEHLSSGLSVASQSQSLKLERQAEGRSLKFPGNQDQFLFYNEIQDLLSNTAASLRKDDTAPALKSIDDAGTLLRQRQKKIKLADKSGVGWLAVKESEAEDLASDFHDEKRIRKQKSTRLRCS